jgi:tetratricopeptide (TPR) repeat protein
VQQYYPLTATSFWLDYHFWKFWTLPYHIENVLLHALAGLLFWRLLLRLRFPGAGLAAALFTLHPVMVESVAWITERKNVLSLVLYFAALLAYERYAPWSNRQPGTGQTAHASAAPPSTKYQPLYYGLAFILFLGALLAKTTTFSLPAVILLLAWWQRGRLRWRADILPTLPFFAISLGMCAVTAWYEKNHVGAQGDNFTLTCLQRCLVAGHVFWFYPGKLFWPADLCFVYPRWQPDPAVWWQWLYPVAAVALLSALWCARKRIGRGPVTAAFFYTGALLPLLGFINAYGMRYAFVWNHWVYLPSLGPLALLACAVARQRRRALVYGFSIVVLPVLGLLTWQEAKTFADMETLWRATLARNPQCWMAQSNLGNLLNDQGKPAEAEMFYRDALRLNPDYAEAYMNLGIALAEQKKSVEAFQNLEKAIQIDPNFAEGHFNLAIALDGQKRFAEATDHYQRAIQLKPNYPEAYEKLGVAYAMRGDYAKARRFFDQAIQLRPRFAGARYDLGLLLTLQGRWAEAIDQYKQAIQIEPGLTIAHLNLGLALAHEGNPDEAMVHLERAVNLATAQGNIMLENAARAQLIALQAASPRK